MRATTVALLGYLASSAWAPGAASGDVARGDESVRAWHGGANLRTDLGVHRVRGGVGVRFGSLGTTVVLDPKVLIDGRQNDNDLLVEWSPRPGGWGALAGWRVTQVSIDRGRHLHHQLLLGVTVGLPALVDRHVRGRFGTELEITTVRHGSGIETDFISFRSERHWRDLVSINMFARFEYAGAL